MTLHHDRRVRMVACGLVMACWHGSIATAVAGPGTAMRSEVAGSGDPSPSFPIRENPNAAGKRVRAGDPRALSIARPACRAPACRAPARDSNAGAQPGIGERPLWRRAARGWEDRRKWSLPEATRLPRITRVHPAIVGALQALIAFAALLSFPAKRQKISFSVRNGQLRATNKETARLLGWKRSDRAAKAGPKRRPPLPDERDKDTDDAADPADHAGLPG